MKTLLILLLPFFGFAQIDLTKITMPDDSTVIVTAKDTSYFEFQTKEFPRDKKTTTVFQANRFEEKAGNKTLVWTTGVLAKREYITALKQRIGTLQGEFDVNAEYNKNIKTRIDFMKAEIIKVQ